MLSEAEWRTAEAARVQDKLAEARTYQRVRAKGAAEALDIAYRVDLATWLEIAAALQGESKGETR